MDWMTKYDAKLVEVRMKIVRYTLSDMKVVRTIFIIDCDKELYKTSFKTVRIAFFKVYFLSLSSIVFSLEILQILSLISNFLVWFKSTFSFGVIVTTFKRNIFVQIDFFRLRTFKDILERAGDGQGSQPHGVFRYHPSVGQYR